MGIMEKSGFNKVRLAVMKSEQEVGAILSEHSGSMKDRKILAREYEDQVKELRNVVDKSMGTISYWYGLLVGEQMEHDKLAMLSEKVRNQIRDF